MGRVLYLFLRKQKGQELDINIEEKTVKRTLRYIARIEGLEETLPNTNPVTYRFSLRVALNLDYFDVSDKAKLIVEFKKLVKENEFEKPEKLIDRITDIIAKYSTETPFSYRFSAESYASADLPRQKFRVEVYP